MFNFFDLTSTDDYQYLLSAVGTDVVKNDTDTIRAIITNTNLEQKHDDRRISSLSELRRGDLIKYDDNKWMIISEVNGTRYNKYKGIMRRCNYEVEFVVGEEQIITGYDGLGRPIFQTIQIKESFPSIIETQYIGVEEGRVINLSTGIITVTLQENVKSLKIKLNDEFAQMDAIWKVIGIDRTKTGQIVLTCEKGAFVETDGTVQITNTKPIELYEGNSLQLTWITSLDFPVVFSTSNESIATVDALGIVTGVSSGQVTITVHKKSNVQINDSVTVNIIEAPESYNLNITGLNEVPTNQTENYTAQVYNGSTLITDGSQPVTWSLWDDTKTTTTTFATIQSQNGTSCTIKAGGTANKYVQLKATLNSDNTIVAWYRIRVKPLY